MSAAMPLPLHRSAAPRCPAAMPTCTAGCGGPRTIRNAVLSLPANCHCLSPAASMFLARSPALWGLAVGCYLAEPEHTDIKLKYGEVPGFGFEFDDYMRVTCL